MEPSREMDLLAVEGERTSGPVDAARQTDAFAALVARHQRRVAGLVHRLLGWPQGIDDVVQDVFAAVLRGWPKFRGDCAIETWLYRITVNECRRARRRRLLGLRFFARRDEVSQRTAPEAKEHAAPDAVLAREEQLEIVRRAVRRLAVRDREVVVLRYLEDLPSAAIGRILGISANAVEVRLNRARQRLRAALVELKD